jgi:hypothetical protein
MRKRESQVSWKMPNPNYGWAVIRLVYLKLFDELKRDTAITCFLPSCSLLFRVANPWILPALRGFAR